MSTGTKASDLVGRAADRTAIAAITSVPLILVTLSLMPAIAVLPFLPDGADRAYNLISRLTNWTRSITGALR